MKYYEVKFTFSTAEPTIINNVRDVVAALAGEAGFESFQETEQGLTGYIQQDAFDEQLLRDQLGMLPFDGVSVSFSTDEAEYRDWNEQWEEQGFSPIAISSGIVIHDGRHRPEDIAEGTTLIEINARMAFGTGTHETTRLMANAISTLPLQGKTVLDCGTGTGILAIVALKCGADRAVGYDIDEWSGENAKLNARKNGVDQKLKVLLGDAKVLDGVDEKFNIVTANINRNILLNDMEAMRSKMAPGGTLLLSGFYTDDTPLLQERAEGLGLSLTDQWQQDGWACLMMKGDK
ncbi:MAG: 50S ribosomal protein L11 methyltransferase [Prevotella sp.]|nr:50S ribosomal protein L11 methyltransferase [Prevotella sp.]